MSENAMDSVVNNGAPAESTTNISNEQIDKFFETRGDASAAGIKEERTTSVNETIPRERREEREVEVQQDKHQAEIEKSYKAALAEERAKTKEIQNNLRAIQERAEAAERQYQEMMRRIQSPEPVQQPPNPDEDPLSFLMWKNQTLEQQLQQHAEYLRQEYEAKQQQAQVMEQRTKIAQFVEDYKNTALEFKKERPDFTDAYNHLVKSREEELVIAGYTLDQARALVVEDELAIVSLAKQRGENPAQRMYEIAKARGYQPKAMDEPVIEAQTRAPGKLDVLSEGVKNSKSLGSTGAVESGRFKASDIDDMSDSEFDKFWDEKVSGRKMRF